MGLQRKNHRVTGTEPSSESTSVCALDPCHGMGPKPKPGAARGAGCGVHWRVYGIGIRARDSLFQRLSYNLATFIRRIYKISLTLSFMENQGMAGS